MADANIFAQYLRPAKTVADYQAEGDAADLRRQQLIGAQRQNALASLVAQQQQQTMAETAADNERVRQAYAETGGDQNRLLSILRGPTATKGTVAHADSVEAAMLKRRETLAKAGKEEGETTDIALKRYSGMLGTYVKDPQTAALWYQAQYTDPVIGKMMQQVHGPIDQVVGQIPQDPQGFARWVQQTREGMTKYAESTAPKPTEVKLGNRVAFIDTNPQSPTFRQELNSSAIGTSPDTVYTQGQENYRQGARLKQEKELAGQAVTYQQDGNGNIVALPSKVAPGTVVRASQVAAPGGGLLPLQGKDAGLNDSQSKSYLFGSRMQAANQILSKLADQGVLREGNINMVASSLPLVGGAGDIGTNWTQSDAQQQVKQAKRDFMLAALRRESGASIAPSEYEAFDKTYFPQPGDGPDVIANKAALRQRAVDGMLIEVPQNKRPKMEAPAGKPATSGLPSASDIDAAIARKTNGGK